MKRNVKLIVILLVLLFAIFIFVIWFFHPPKSKLFQRVTLKKINDHIYLMNDHDEATGYLVLGSEKALVIDTMYGYEDVQAIVRTITDLPVVLVNTHSHVDHIRGNVFFSEAYINEADLAAAKQYWNVFHRRLRMLRYGHASFSWKTITPGDIIDLGGIQLEVLSMAGHTPGSIGLLDRKDRILFTGDAINWHVWMQMDESLPMTDYLHTLDQLETIRNEYDYILSGHSNDLIDAALNDALHQAAREVVDGKTDNDQDYSWFQGTSPAHQCTVGDITCTLVYK